MNCSDISSILDNRDIRRLSAAESKHVQAHLSSCRDCASDWQAHEQLAASAVPAVPPGLLEQCRASLDGSIAAHRRRGGTRTVIIGSVLLFTAAAATVVGVQVNTGASGESAARTQEGSALPPASIGGPTDSSALSSDTSAERGPVAGAAAAQGTAAAIDISEPPASVGTHTVAVTPLRHRTTDPLAISITESIYAALLDELRALPHLIVVELDVPAASEPNAAAAAGSGAAPRAAPATTPAVPAASTASAASAASAAPRGELPPDREAPTGGASAASETRTLVLVDGRPQEQGNDGREVDLSFIPSVLIDRMTDVTGGASAQYGSDTTAGVVNVILSRDITGLSLTQVAETYADGEDEHTLGSDYRIDVTSSSRATASGTIWQLNVSGASRKPAPRASASVSGPVSMRIEPAATANDMVDRLRRTLFPPDDWLFAQLQARVADAAATGQTRLAALEQLQEIDKRSGSRGRNEAVVRAALEIASSADAEIRLKIWQSLHGIGSAFVLRPLADSALYDADSVVRLEAIKILATDFAGNATARTVLDTVARTDSSSNLRMHAKWGALDDAGRREWVTSAISSTNLTDAERLAPLQFALDAPRTGMADVGIGSLVTGSTAAALVEILRRLDEPAVMRLSGGLASIDAPELAAFYRDSMLGDARENVRILAVLEARRYLDAPGMRAALTRAQVEDPSERVRSTAARALAQR